MTVIATIEAGALALELDAIAERAGHWLRDRRSSDDAGFGLSPSAYVPAELNATTGGVELWVMLGLPLPIEQRAGWIAHLAGHQHERTGLVVDPTWRGRQSSPDETQLTEGDSFFTMTTAAALECLGSGLPHPVRYLAELSVDELAASIDWEWIAHNPRGVGDLGPLVRQNVRLGVPGAAEQWSWLQRMLVDTQHETGFWAHGSIDGPLTPHINRAFHVLRSSWNLAGFRLERAERLVDACLAAADDPDFYSWETGFACNDLDLAHVAYSAAAWTDHRRDELAAWARRALGSILAIEKPEGGFSFFHEAAMDAHAGIRMSPSAREADTWGTLMYLGTIKMMTELGWPGTTAPWAFSRVHAVPGGGPR